MIAGLILSNSEQEESHITFLGDDTVSFSVKENSEIMEKIKEFKPEILAVDCGTEQMREELTPQEKDLKEEGYSFTPTSMEKKKSKRLQALKAALTREGVNPEFIRFEPYITSKELAIDSDQALNSIGVDTDGLENSHQFDAMLGAVTARFYQQDQFRDLGVIVPESLYDDSDDEDRKP